jgi:hypothetical protein
MGMGISDIGRRIPATGMRHAVSGKLLGALTLALIGAGCGTSSQAPFAWVQPQPVPQHWAVVRIASGSELAYPPGWRIVPGDRGTATAALLGEGGRYLGYLNVTPRQGDENVARWASFRIAHNADEGDTAVKRIAAATGLRFRAGHGSCVQDSYTTRTGARYIEVACLIAGRRAESVIVGAAPPDSWSRTSPALERAISASKA